MSDMTSNPKTTRYQERRRNNRGRRAKNDRRNLGERRCDYRSGSGKPRRTFGMWWRSLTKARLGVDRRKQDRRMNSDRRQQNLNNLLTEEEVSELLNWKS